MDSDSTKLVDPVSSYTVLLVRGAIVGAGLAGFLLYTRNSRLFASYQQAAQIPGDFFTKGTRLKGRVREIESNGGIRLEYRPLIKLPFPIGPKSLKKPILLNTRLAGLDVSSAGINHLVNKLRIENRQITFVPIGRDLDADILEVDISLKKNLLFSVNLNVDLVRRGYARVFDLSVQRHALALQSSTAYARLITKLIVSEKVAERRGIGLWERESWVESMSSLPSTYFQLIMASPITKLLILIYELLRDLVLLAFYLTRQSVHLSKQGYNSTITHASNGYQKFTSIVNTLNKGYLSARNIVQARIGGSPKR